MLLGLKELQEWPYSTWNERLFDHVFGNPDDGEVERITVSPEELCNAVGVRQETALKEDVALAFAEACKTQVPSGRGFQRYYETDIRGRLGWSPRAEDIPPHFGLLWLTCLMAYGWPNASLQFGQRVENWAGRPMALTHLPSMWQSIADWSAQQHEAGKDIPALQLPPVEQFGNRTLMGHSYFLAFPHALDRLLLSRRLEEAGLVDLEPNVPDVLVALDDRSGFGESFLEDLREFRDTWTQIDLSSNAFWRAVLLEARNPTCRGVARRRRSHPFTLIGKDDLHGGLQIECVHKEGWTPPTGFMSGEIEAPFEDFTHTLNFRAGEENASAEAAVAEIIQSPQCLGRGGVAKLVEEGLLAFRPSETGRYYLANGYASTGNRIICLVRTDLSDRFREVFGGGTPYPCDFLEGWMEHRGMQLRVMDPGEDLPEGLESLRQLLPGARPQTVDLAGGIRLGGDEYLNHPELLPFISKEGVDTIEEVRVTTSENISAQCTDEDRGWALPPEVCERRARSPDTGAEDEIVVRLEARFANGGRKRRRFRLAKVSQDRFKYLTGGDHWREGAGAENHTCYEGEPVPLDTVSNDERVAEDMLFSDPTGRFLGPGIGEFSQDQGCGFDWYAVGPLNRPSLLLFVGDDARPIPPSDARSPDSGDRRHWRKAFQREEVIRVWNPQNGEIVTVEEAPAVREALRMYRRYRPENPDWPEVPVTDLARHEPLGRREPDPRVANLADALAARSNRTSTIRPRGFLEDMVTVCGSRLESLRLRRLLLRAWWEAGLLDLVSGKAYNALKVATRRPQLVLTRYGDRWEATVAGTILSDRLGTSPASDHTEYEQGGGYHFTPILKAGHDRGLEYLPVKPSSPWQPLVPRFRGRPQQIVQFAEQTGLWPQNNEPLWLKTSSGGDLVLETEQQGFREGGIPPGYTPIREWCWERNQFCYDAELPSLENVRLRIFKHPQPRYLFCIELDGSHHSAHAIMNWALLRAHELAGRKPFRIDERGWVAAPHGVHLPIALGRICAFAGEGLPGPVLDNTNQIQSYLYPFGLRLGELVRREVPDAWLDLNF